ncbi:ATPase, partial [Streptomyces sp. W16]|nr:ATPase [Streptomyces sp. W16]
APADRPALASPRRSSAEPANGTPPPGVTTLRLHRPAEDAEGPEDSDDLPRRVRQASLAPQLREQPAADRERAPAAPREEHRSPEVVRDRMAAYREGWTRGGGRQPGRGATPGPATGSDSSEGDRA